MASLLPQVLKFLAAAVAAVIIPLAIFVSWKPKRLPPAKVVTNGVQFEVVNNKELRIFRLPCEKADKNLTFFCIHGLGGELDQFEGQLAFLSKFGNVIAVDFVGHGQSPSSANEGDYSTTAIVKDLETIIEANHTDQNVLIGHSYGSILAAKISLRPSMARILKGMVLIASKSSIAGGAATMVKVPTWLIEIIRAFDRLGGVNSKSVLRMMHPSAPAAMRRRQLGLAASNSMRDIKPLIRGMQWMSEDEWKKLEVPFILIQGDSDTVTPPHGVDALRDWCTSVLMGLHIIEGAGHTVMMEKATEVNTLIERFLRGLGLLARTPAATPN